MLKYFTEFVGTFIFLTVILMATARGSPLSNIAPLAIGGALVAVICFGGSISGGHFNPAVSTMMVLNKSLPSSELLPYVAAQVLGGVAAWKFAECSARY